MRHLMSPLDFSVEELDKLLDLANDIEKFPGKYAHACDGKKLATCFYEPSTRKKQWKMEGESKWMSEANGRRWSGRGEFVERNRDVGF